MGRDPEPPTGTPDSWFTRLHHGQVNLQPVVVTAGCEGRIADAAVAVVVSSPGVSMHTPSNSTTEPSGLVASPSRSRVTLELLDAGDIEDLFAGQAEAVCGLASGNCSGRTPMPMRLERWMRS